MKRTLLLIPLLVLVTCSTTETIRQSDDPWLSDELPVFIAGFMETVRLHDAPGVMYYLDEGYVHERLAVNLRGNTEQFLDELFGGSFNSISSVIAPVFPSSLTEGCTGPVTFMVHFTTGRSKIIRLYIRRLRGGERYYAILGALG